MKKIILLPIAFLMTNILFADPFGLKMGMILEEIKGKCDGKEPEYRGRGYLYNIEPIKKDKFFREYTACFNDNLGLFGVDAMTDVMSKGKCEEVFNLVLPILEDYYGEPSEVEVPFKVWWFANKCEKLKKEKLVSIFLTVKSGSGRGMMFLGYRFENFDKAMESADSPF